MKLPFWILALLIFISIAFAGYASYQLYLGKAIDKSGANEVISNAIDAVPSVQSGANIKTLAKDKDAVKVSTPVLNPQRAEEAKPQQIRQNSLERNARKIGIQNNIDKSIEEGKRVLKKIGDIAVIAGEARKIALVG